MTLDPQVPPVARDATGTAGSTDAELGQRLYGQICQSCHGPDGNMIADHKLSKLAARRDLASTVEYIKHPKAPMPAMYPQLLDERSVAAVAAWVHAEL
jgi:mono/diheme cytochrome c family protein